MSHDIEPDDDGRCEVHHGVVKAVERIPRLHLSTHTTRDRDGHTHTGVHVSQHEDRALWITAPGAPDRRIPVPEWFAALPGHEVVLVAAPGAAYPFRYHNLSTGELVDLFQPAPFDPLEFLAACAFGAGLLALPVWAAVVALWYDVRPGWGDPPWGPLAAAVYAAALVLVLALAVPHAGTKATRRQWARRVVDTEIAAFDDRRRRRDQRLIEAPRPGAEIKAETWW